MLIYFLLIAYILILPLIVSPFVGGNKRKTQVFTALFGMLAVFLLLALKGTSVGIDIKGYEEQYYLSRIVSWDNFHYVYFENGYILIEKIFSKAGIPFQWFAAIIYFLECSSIGLLIAKFSKDARLSIIFFICYQFLVFSTSGLRQTLAFALCMFAFLLYTRRKLLSYIAGTLIVLLTTTIHTSAFIFLVIAVVMIINEYFRVIPVWEIIGVIVMAFLARGSLWLFVDRNIRSIDTNTGVSFSGSLLFLTVIALFGLFSFHYSYGYGLFGRKNLLARQTHVRPDYYDSLSVRVAVCAVVFHIVLSGGVMLRGLMYVNLMLIFFLPQMLDKYALSHRIAIKGALIIMLILMFYYQSLAVNQLHICPYVFFWET